MPLRDEFERLRQLPQQETIRQFLARLRTQDQLKQQVREEKLREREILADARRKQIDNTLQIHLQLRELQGLLNKQYGFFDSKWDVELVQGKTTASWGGGFETMPEIVEYGYIGYMLKREVQKDSLNYIFVGRYGQLDPTGWYTYTPSSIVMTAQGGYGKNLAGVFLEREYSTFDARAITTTSNTATIQRAQSEFGTQLAQIAARFIVGRR